MEAGFAISKSRELLFDRDLEIAKPNLNGVILFFFFFYY
jgi:hypothetical protein